MPFIKSIENNYHFLDLMFAKVQLNNNSITKMHKEMPEQKQPVVSSLDNIYILNNTYIMRIKMQLDTEIC